MLTTYIIPDLCREKSISRYNTTKKKSDVKFLPMKERIRVLEECNNLLKQASNVLAAFSKLDKKIYLMHRKVITYYESPVNINVPHVNGVVEIEED